MADSSKPAWNRAYVFGVSPQGKPVLAGNIRTRRAGGQFSYENSWLSYPDRYPLDPENLPLRPGSFECTHNMGVFPVFSDAAPDAWGTHIMLLNRRSQPANEIERLLLTSGRGVGSLQFSLSQSRPKQKVRSQDISLLERLYRVAELIDRSQALDDEQLRLLQPGSSMGGARPKTAIHDGPIEYLAKFSKDTDLVDVPRVEFATMRMLRETGLDVPPVRLEPVGRGRSAYLIERFDLYDACTTQHYVSAHAMFNVGRLRQIPDGHKDPAGYVALSHHLRSHSDHFVGDSEQLFLRALTNISLGNTDDHARNFGMCYNLATKQWSLAPVFDVLPIVSATAQPQAMTLGKYGRESSWDNLMSCIDAFGVSEARAVSLAKEHLSVLERWESFYRSAKVSENDIAVLRSVIQPRLSSIVEQVCAKSRRHRAINLDELVLDDIGAQNDYDREEGQAPKRSR